VSDSSAHCASVLPCQCYVIQSDKRFLVPTSVDVPCCRLTSHVHGRCARSRTKPHLGVCRRPGSLSSTRLRHGFDKSRCVWFFLALRSQSPTSSDFVMSRFSHKSRTNFLAGADAARAWFFGMPDAAVSEQLLKKGG
jgi:hypothetical protein